MQTTEPRTVSRQRRHQLEKKAKGLCMTCGEVRSPGSATYCEAHREVVVRRELHRRAKARPLHQFPETLWSKALDAFAK